jgi:dTDP-4-amino-4,6-dideoxygalactose transaminase
MLRDEHHVNTIIANPPVHSTVPFLKAHVGELALPISDGVGARLFCPPIHPGMSDDDNRYVCAAIWDAVERIRRV